jgi:hypothetical protein
MVVAFADPVLLKRSPGCERVACILIIDFPNQELAVGVELGKVQASDQLSDELGGCYVRRNSDLV